MCSGDEILRFHVGIKQLSVRIIAGVVVRSVREPIGEAKGVLGSSFERLLLFA